MTEFIDWPAAAVLLGLFAAAACLGMTAIRASSSAQRTSFSCSCPQKPQPLWETRTETTYVNEDFDEAVQVALICEEALRDVLFVAEEALKSPDDIFGKHVIKHIAEIVESALESLNEEPEPDED